MPVGIACDGVELAPIDAGRRAWRQDDLDVVDVQRLRQQLAQPAEGDAKVRPGGGNLQATPEQRGEPRPRHRPILAGKVEDQRLLLGRHQPRHRLAVHLQPRSPQQLHLQPPQPRDRDRLLISPHRSSRRPAAPD